MNLALRYYFILRLLAREGFEVGRHSLVEIGSGASGVGAFCGTRFVACDLKFPGNKSKHFLPVIANVISLPFKDNSFDFVLSSDMMEHLHEHIRKGAISEMLRIARKNLILAFPEGIEAQECDLKLYNHLKKNRKLVPPWLEEHLEPDHTFPTEDEIENILKKKGCDFEVIKQENVILHAWMVRVETLPIINKIKWIMRNYSLKPIWKVISPLINFGKAYRKIFVIRKPFGIEAQPILPEVNMHTNKEGLSEESSETQKVSVILTVLNEAGSITSVLENLLSQTRKPDEIVIVDGGSTDATIELIKDFSQNHNCVKLVVAKGANISRGRNIAITNAKYPLIAATDGGCRPDPMWLEKLIEPLETDASVGAVKGIFESEPCSLFERMSGLLTLPGSLKKIDEESYAMSGRSSAFRKSVWEKAGGYPEWLYTAEDSLFEEKLKKIGANIRLARQSIVHWRPRKDLRKTGKMFYLYGRGGGRIGKSLKGAHYHLRNYLLGIVLLVISFFYPLTLLVFAAGVAYVYKGYYRPIIGRVKKVYPGWKAEFYVPLIVFIRSLSYSIGLLVGNYEYKHVPGFKENLESYLSAPSASSAVNTHF